ncbi:MAG: methylated-DNA--[protein]-cysteine S-methyltransferase [Candidatus Kapabacteria bacterium]|jgi:methylated-DNA-[protein]-cysteine S-methyltransferase|nr:methylated-DNA--[protein]-cysteine S-methyltransferase [Candidatus Kapabacteria bacterium]
MHSIETQHFPTPFGELLLGTFQGKLCLCDWRYRAMRSAIDKRIQKGLNAEYREQDNEMLAETRKQLGEYWSGARLDFTLPLAFVGTEFQQRVWRELQNVGYGETSTYLALSEKLGNKDAIRAVASANGANAISIIVPCHRIIGSDGSLVGYAGGLPAKKKLLTLENPHFARQFAEQAALEF